MTKIKVCIYARVSSSSAMNRQNTDRQVVDLTTYAAANNYMVDNIFTEHLSGAVPNKNKIVLNECIDYCFAKNIDILLISELSRLGRKVEDILSNIRLCKDNKLNIYFQKENLSIFQGDSRDNPYLNIMIAVLGACAEIERDNTQYRLNSGRKLYIEQGGKLGRKKGSNKSREQKQQQYSEVIDMLRTAHKLQAHNVTMPVHFTIRGIAKACKIGVSTVQRIKKEFVKISK